MEVVESGSMTDRIWDRIEAPPLGEIVAVLWLDAYGDDDGGWHTSDRGKPYPPARCISTGRLLQCDETVVALAPHWTLEPDEVSGLEGGRVIIPTGCVVTILSFSGAVQELSEFQVDGVPEVASGDTKKEKHH